jgi:hypothetical protein
MFSLDTSALVDAWRRDYRQSVFPSLWDRIADLIDGGQLVASMTVRDEIQVQEDELAAWVKGRADLFVEDDGETQARVRAILDNWPHPTDFTRFLKGADPFVIGLAQSATSPLWPVKRLPANLCTRGYRTHVDTTACAASGRWTCSRSWAGGSKAVRHAHGPRRTRGKVAFRLCDPIC